MKLSSYPYDDAYEPAMPILEVEVSAPRSDLPPRSVVALIDSGADGTLLPRRLLEQVGARLVGAAWMRGIAGGRSQVDIYLAHIRIDDHVIRAVRVIAMPDDEALLGRNVLNEIVVTLNGPASTTEIPSV